MYMYGMHICASYSNWKFSTLTNNRGRILYKNVTGYFYIMSLKGTIFIEWNISDTSCNYWLLHLRADGYLYVCHKYTCSNFYWYSCSTENISHVEVSNIALYSISQMSFAPHLQSKQINVFNFCTFTCNFIRLLPVNYSFSTHNLHIYS